MKSLGERILLYVASKFGKSLVCLLFTCGTFRPVPCIVFNLSDKYPFAVCILPYEVHSAIVLVIENTAAGLVVAKADLLVEKPDSEGLCIAQKGVTGAAPALNDD